MKLSKFLALPLLVSIMSFAYSSDFSTLFAGKTFDGKVLYSTGLDTGMMVHFAPASLFSVFSKETNYWKLDYETVRHAFIWSLKGNQLKIDFYDGMAGDRSPGKLLVSAKFVIENVGREVDLYSNELAFGENRGVFSGAYMFELMTATFQNKENVLN